MMMANMLVVSLVAQGPVCSHAAVAAYAKNLTAKYTELKAAPGNQEKAQRFFRALPDSFQCFYAVFGYPNESPGPLYSEPELHFLFPRLAAAVSPAEYAQKVVQLSVDARWEADQTGALQEAACALLDQHAALFIVELARMSTNEEGSVWHFLFDGPHPSNVPVAKDVRRSVCSLSQRSCQWLDRAYREALAREKREH